MKDSVERIRRGDKLPYIERLKQKTLISELTSTAGHSHTLFTLGRDRTGSGFHMIGGLARVSDAVVIAYDRSGTMLTVDVKNRTMSVNEGSSGVKHNQIVDLTVEGERWEGDVLNGKPCGWGVLYDKDNRMAYEGFRFGEASEGYGRKYYADISTIEYAGEWVDGKRWGRGVQYNRNGAVVYDGEWVQDRHVEKILEVSGESYLVHNHLERLSVSDGCCSEEGLKELDLSGFESLRELKVGDMCFSHVVEVKVIGLSALESVAIGMNCFTKGENGYDFDRNCRFYLKNCPKLKSLKIDRYSFSTYSVCVIEKVDALEVIEMGDLNEESYNFFYAPLELKGILHSQCIMTRHAFSHNTHVWRRRVLRVSPRGV